MTENTSLSELTQLEIELGGARRGESQHILLAIFRWPGSNAERILRLHGITRERVLQEIELVKEAGGEEPSTEPDGAGRPRSLSFRSCFDVRALCDELEPGETTMTLGHMLLRMLSVESIAGRILTNLGLTKSEVRKLLSTG